MTLYPIGYGTTMVSMGRLREVHEPRMHPEDARRVFPYLESKEGLLGIGGGFRTAPAPGGAPLDKSFHWWQDFASGIRAYCAQDLVAVNTASLTRRIFSLNGSPQGRSTLRRALSVAPVHRAPTWAETEDAPQWGLHTFIMKPPEPWHLQPIEIRGWQTWVLAGRKDPVANIPLPNDPPPEEEYVLEYVLVPDPGHPDTQPWWPWVASYTSGERCPLGPTKPNVPHITVVDIGQYRRICAAANIQLLVQFP